MFSNIIYYLMFSIHSLGNSLEQMALIYCAVAGSAVKDKTKN